jgi:hypothetical protein
MPAHAQDSVFPFICLELLLMGCGHFVQPIRVKLTTDLHLVSRLRMHEFLLSTSPRACTVCIWTTLYAFKTITHRDSDCSVYCQTMPAITSFACQSKSFSPVISLYKFNVTYEVACHVIFQRKLAILKVFLGETVLTNESKAM